jgi:signal transduction histidine kinase
MIAPDKTKDEAKRLQELASYDIMDSDMEKDFDNLTKLASEICQTNISLVSLIDGERQWFKSRKGLKTQETPKKFSFCGHAIHEPDKVFIVNDARQDKRFHDNPLVTGEPHVIFYAGIPLIAESGYSLGTLCVIDDKPKELTEKQLNALRILSGQVMKLIELRKKRKLLKQQKLLLEQKNEEIERFANVAAHDLKSPLNNISQLIDLLQDQGDFKDDSQLMLEMVKSSAERLTNLIDQLLKFSKVEKLSIDDKTEITPSQLIDDLKSVILNDTDNCTIQLITKLDKLNVNTTGVSLILQNLVTNSIKYNDKRQTLVEIEINEKECCYEFEVKDNGPGISYEFKEKIFEPFTVLKGTDKFGNRGNGLGLSHVKKIVDKMGGIISFNSKIGIGTKFSFSVGKDN